MKRTRTTRQVEKKPAEEIPVSEYDEEQGNGYETEPQPLKRAGSRLAKTVKNEANRRATGLADTTTDLLRTGSDGVGQIGKFVRQQTGNLKQLGTSKLGLLSTVTGAFTDVTTNLMQSAQNIVGVGAKALNGVVKDATKTAGSGVELGGRVLRLPIKATNHALQFGNGAIQIPTKLTKLGSKGARKTLSLFGIHSDEDDKKNVNVEEIEEDVAPPPPPPSPTRARQTQRRVNSRN